MGPFGSSGRVSAFTLAAAIALSAGSSGCSVARAEEAKAAPEAVPVETTVVAHGAARRMRAAGILRAKSELDLAFKVGGVLAQVRVDRGAAVKKGQVVATLDATEVAAGLRQADEAERRAARELARAQRLFDDGALPKNVLDDAATQSATAEAAASAARFNASRAVLVAPEDGWIDLRAAEPGEIVAPGRPIVRMSGKERGWVMRASFADRDAVHVSRGAAARVTLDVRDGEPLAGVVTQVAPLPTAGTGAYEIEVRVDAPPSERLLSGLSGKVEIERAEPALVPLPVGALVDASGHEAAVFAVRDGVARRVPLRVAFFAADTVAASAELADGEAVVTRGAAGLRDGERVRVVSGGAVAAGEKR